MHILIGSDWIEFFVFLLCCVVIIVNSQRKIRQSTCVSIRVNTFSLFPHNITCVWMLMTLSCHHRCVIPALSLWVHWWVSCRWQGRLGLHPGRVVGVLYQYHDSDFWVMMSVGVGRIVDDPVVMLGRCVGAVIVVVVGFLVGDVTWVLLFGSVDWCGGSSGWLWAWALWVGCGMGFVVGRFPCFGYVSSSSSSLFRRTIFFSSYLLDFLLDFA